MIGATTRVPNSPDDNASPVERTDAVFAPLIAARRDDLISPVWAWGFDPMQLEFSVTGAYAGGSQRPADAFGLLVVGARIALGESANPLEVLHQRPIGAHEGALAKPHGVHRDPVLFADLVGELCCLCEALLDVFARQRSGRGDAEVGLAHGFVGGRR